MYIWSHWLTNIYHTCNHNDHTIPYVHNTTYETCTKHHMYTTSHIQHAPNTILHNIAYPTSTQHHLYTTLQKHVHNTIYTQHCMYITSLLQHVQYLQHIDNSSIADPKTTLSLPRNLASNVFPPSMLALTCCRSHFFHSADVPLNITCHIIYIV